MDISRRPQPCLSGRDGWAPTRTLFALASWTVSFMMEKSLVESVHGEFAGIELEHVKSSRSVETARDVREVDGLHEGFIVALPAQGSLFSTFALIKDKRPCVQSCTAQNPVKSVHSVHLSLDFSYENRVGGGGASSSFRSAHKVTWELEHCATCLSTTTSRPILARKVRIRALPPHCSLRATERNDAPRPCRS